MVTLSMIQAMGSCAGQHPAPALTQWYCDRISGWTQNFYEWSVLYYALLAAGVIGLALSIRDDQRRRRLGVAILGVVIIISTVFKATSKYTTARDVHAAVEDAVGLYDTHPNQDTLLFALLGAQKVWDRAAPVDVTVLIQQGVAAAARSPERLPIAPVKSSGTVPPMGAGGQTTSASSGATGSGSATTNSQLKSDRKP